MKKLVSLVGLCAVLGLAACDKAEEAPVAEQPVVAQMGDTVVINFAGFLDGNQFPGGTAENYSLTLGSNAFVAGFEEQVAGMSEGEERDINITFPADYVEGLAGKAVVFKVKVVDVVGK